MTNPKAQVSEFVPSAQELLPIVEAFFNALSSDSAAIDGSDLQLLAAQLGGAELMETESANEHPQSNLHPPILDDPHHEFT